MRHWHKRLILPLIYGDWVTEPVDRLSFKSWWSPVLRLHVSSRDPRTVSQPADDDLERINLQPINSFSPNRMKETLSAWAAVPDSCAGGRMRCSDSCSSFKHQATEQTPRIQRACRDGLIFYFSFFFLLNNICIFYICRLAWTQFSTIVGQNRRSTKYNVFIQQSWTLSNTSALCFRTSKGFFHVSNHEKREEVTGQIWSFMYKEDQSNFFLVHSSWLMPRAQFLS